MKLFLALLFALLVPAAALAGAPSYQENCKTWLGLVDAGRYEESWDAASPYFQTQITKAQWAPMVKAVRDAVGEVKSRGAANVTPTDTLPNAPFGKYLVIVIRTNFQMNPTATETIIMKLENGEWRVAGYFIK